ncbi:glutamate receptor ionotropic, kainate 2-like isoform X8 [Agrilus planipennis]|uniref:Glutamate receptor ionotropic, kainate 2-like isoform X8 n=1 Tax=Agrilus planipennis TaxID=224129 RepID=A0A1W4WL20_AGRPL|nr:glutamate receptor ionotropic, kainate 2-like isoform X8 [Agrilus planipennis]
MQFGICWAIFGFAHTILAALALPPIIKIGAIFTEEERNGSVEIAFKYAVHKINKDRSLLPKTNLVYDIQYVKKDDSFHACKKACSQVRMGVHAVFGPSDPLLASHIHSICDALDIPHLEVRLDPEADSREFSINLYPAQKLLNLAFQDIMSFLNWTRFAIIYEEDFGLIKLRELVKSSQSSKIEVYLRQADVTSYRRVLKEIKSKEINNFIVDTKPENLQDFLKGILQLQMNDYKYHYLFTTFDLETFDLEDFKYNFVNMTAFRIIDTKDLTVQEILRDMARFQPHHLRPSSLNSSFVKTEAALIYDSVFVFAVGLQTLDQSHTLRIQNASCDREEPWDGGLSLINYINSKADLAVGSMTINYARESVIDFTKPFMNLGISILFKVPSSQQARLFSFMNPLAMDIWLYVLSAYLLVSVTMFVVARFSPHEWHNPHPCQTDNDIIENQFSLPNSFWFTIGTLMQQGSDLNPKATSTRIVGGIWWFFTLIMISSYTANLAAFLTVERMITPIENAEDLASQTEITYGTLESGSTMTFFRDSMIETYKKMWRFMENKKPSVFVPTYEEGIKRVLEGNYAFLMESTMLDYIVQRNCNLTQIGGLLDSKGYGIATPMGSPWRDKISLAILDLQEKGEIQMLYDKWWKNTGETCSRDDKGKESKANSLGVDNIGGVFVVLLCGLAFAVIVAICEFCYNSRKGNGYSKRNMALLPQQSLCTEMASELCFAMRCRASRQRPALRRQCSKCLAKIANHDATGVGDGAGGGVATNPILPPPSAPRSSAKVPAPATSLVLLPHQFNFSPILGNENRQCFEDLKERLQKPETIKVNSSTNTVEPPPKTKRETLVN